MTTEGNNSIHDLLHKTPLKEMVPSIGEAEIVTVKDTDTVEELVFTLSDNKIISAPVCDSTGCCIGMVDMLDVISHVISVSPTPNSLKRNELQSLEICGRAMALEKVENIINASGKDPFVPVYEENPASMVAELFSNGAHRVPILTPENTVVHTVSQSDIVRFLSKKIHMGHAKEVGELTTSALGLGKSPVVSVDKKETVINAMLKLKTAGVSALAVVDEDEDGKLCGNFSATDLKGLFKEEFPSLLLSVDDYLTKHSEKSKSPICIPEDASLIEVIKELVESSVHRVWILDEDYKPKGVISMTDIFKVVRDYRPS